MKTTLLAVVLCILPLLAKANAPEVVAVEAIQTGATWQFNVTLRHADTGWDHYADGWGIYTEGGVELGYRVLAHPHVNEQPFTRGLASVSIPTDTSRVIIRPRDLVHGEGPDFVFELPTQ